MPPKGFKDDIQILVDNLTKYRYYDGKAFPPGQHWHDWTSDHRDLMRRDARYKKQFGADLEEAYFNLIQLYQDTENNPDDKDLKELYQDLPLSVKVLLTGKQWPSLYQRSSKGTGEGHMAPERLNAGPLGKLEDLHDYGSDEIYPSSAQLGPTFKDFRCGPPRFQQREIGNKPAVADDIELMVADFMETKPSDDAIEQFWVSKVLPRDKRSIDEIMDDYHVRNRLMKPDGTFYKTSELHKKRKLGQPSKDWRSHRDKSFRRKRGRL